MRNGRACGSRSAYSRPGGAAPLCDPSDVTPVMIESYKQRQVSRRSGAASQQVAITSLGHPSGAREVAFERSPRAVGVAVRVNMQDDPRDIAPVGTVRIGIEQAQVRDEMLLVVGGNRWIGCRSAGKSCRIRLEPWKRRSVESRQSYHHRRG